MSRWIVASGVVIGALAVAGATAVGVGGSVWTRETAQAVSHLRDGMRHAASAEEPPFSGAPPEPLPAPVARYLRFALPEGQPRIRSAHVRWTGEFQTRPGGGWAPFTADQHFTTRPPGFVWDARIRMLPLLPVRVRDGYRNGSGTVLGRIGAVVPVVEAGGTPEIAQSALARWLGEAVWLPTALGPGGAVRWEAVDDSTARASVSDGGIRVTAEFHFAPTGEITRMTAMRYRDVGGSAELTPFEGRYGRYERMAGVMIPMDAEVAWQLPDGRFPYWRGRPDAVEYEATPAGREAPTP